MHWTKDWGKALTPWGGIGVGVWGGGVRAGPGSGQACFWPGDSGRGVWGVVVVVVGGPVILGGVRGGFDIYF